MHMRRQLIDRPLVVYVGACPKATPVDRPSTDIPIPAILLSPFIGGLLHIRQHGNDVSSQRISPRGIRRCNIDHRPARHVISEPNQHRRRAVSPPFAVARHAVHCGFRRLLQGRQAGGEKVSRLPRTRAPVAAGHRWHRELTRPANTGETELRRVSRAERRVSFAVVSRQSVVTWQLDGTDAVANDSLLRTQR